MKNKFLLSLKTKIVFTNILVVAFFASSLVVMLNILFISTLTGMKRDTVKSVIEGEARRVAFALSQPLGVVEDLANQEKIVEYFAGGSKAKDSEIIDFFKAVSIGREYSNVYLMDTIGEVVLSIDPTFLANNFAFRDYFKEALAGKTHMQIAFGVLTHKPGYYFSAPVVKDGVTVGVVVIKMDVSYIDKMLVDPPTKSIGYYFLTDENGVVISSDKEIEEYQSMGVIPKAKQQKLVEERRFEGFGLKPLQYQVVQDVIDNYKTPVSLDFMDKEDDENELLQVHKVGEYPFFLVTESDFETILAQVAGMIWKITALMGGVVTVGIILQYLIFEKMLKPLSTLEKFTRDVAQGKIDTSFNIQSGDELQSLSESVAKLILSLSEAKLELEKKVSEKTEELNKKLAELNAKNTQMSTSEMAMINLLEDAKSLEEQLKIEKEGVEKQVVERTRELSEEQAELVAVINSISRGLLVVDKGWQVILENESLKSILKTKKEVSYLDLVDFLSDRLDLNKMVAESFAQNIPVKNPAQLIGTRYLDIHTVPVLHGEIVGAVAIFVKDVTEEITLQRSRDEFFSIASHELRTPLTAIRGNTSMILDYYADQLKDAELKQMIDDTHEASVRLIGIVNDFLDMSRLEMGKVEYKIEDVKVFSIVDKVVKDLSENAKTKGVELKVEGDENVFARVDVGKVEQILFNIIGNSLKFTDKGSVTIKVYSETDFAHIEIEDTGKGIPQANQSLLFHKFQQAGSSLTTREGAKGTGLGLYISRLMTEGMGGKLWLIKSEEGKGSVFGISLPIVKM